jgi:hypothetical protein
MIYAKHRAGPPPEAFEAVRLVTPNISGRMDNLRAAICAHNCAGWPANAKLGMIAITWWIAPLGQVASLTRVKRPQQEKFVASTYQFLLLDWSGDAIRDMVVQCLARGVELKWFGAVELVGFISRYDS